MLHIPRLDLSHCPFLLLSLCYPPSCLSHCPFSLLSLYAAYSPSWFVSLSVFTVVPMLSPVLFVSLSVFTVVPICCIFPVLICLTVCFHCCSNMLHNLLLDLSHCPFFLFPLACLDLMSVLSCLIVGLYTFVSIASYSIPRFWFVLLSISVFSVSYAMYQLFSLLIFSAFRCYIIIPFHDFYNCPFSSSPQHSTIWYSSPSQHPGCISSIHVLVRGESPDNPGFLGHSVVSFSTHSKTLQPSHPSQLLNILYTQFIAYLVCQAQQFRSKPGRRWIVPSIFFSFEAGNCASNFQLQTRKKWKYWEISFQIHS